MEFSNFMYYFNKFKFLNSKSGFSLIELLVGIAIIITATTVVLSIIVSSFRITSKNTSSDRVRQAGNNAVSQIIRMVQFSEYFYGMSKDFGNTIVDSCDPPDEIYNAIKIKYRGVDKIISCSIDSNIKIQSNGESAMEMFENEKYRVNNCKITCIKTSDYSPPKIGLSFDLDYGNEGAVSEKTSKINFSTTIKMRNN